MGVFNLSSSINPNKVFLINRSEIEGRLEAEYYRPEINLLEKKIRKKTSKRLKNFIIKIASGATPSVTEEDKYYSDKESGIPFLRVQNLQTNGKLYLEDLKYINKETHEKYLKRSQVAAGDLLIKITGVGRMAIASVAPEGFIGNTNQHMVVVKTGSRKTSEYLSNYLNLDIVEKLATRRSTGATRPALDYPALKSIPIIEGIDFSILEKAEIQAEQKKNESLLLLKSIDTFILKELGITLPEKENNITNRIFTTNYSQLTGSRLDPKLYDSITKNLIKAIENSTYPKLKLKNLIVQSCAGDWGKDENEGAIEGYVKCLVVRATEFDNNGNLNLDNSRVKFRLINQDKLKKIDVKENDLLIEKSGGSIDQPVGRIAILTKDYIKSNQLCYSNFIHKIRVDSEKVNPEYLFYFLKAIHNMKLTDAMQSQTNGIRNLIMRNYFNQFIVLPTPKKQSEIVNHIEKLREKASLLQLEGKNILDFAKRKIQNQLI